MSKEELVALLQSRRLEIKISYETPYHTGLDEPDDEIITELIYDGEVIAKSYGPIA